MDKVVIKSPLIKELTDIYRYSPAALRAMDERNKQNDAVTESAVREYDQYRKDSEAMTVKESLVMRQLQSDRLPFMLDNISRTGKELVFKDIMFEAFRGALYLDPSFIQLKEANLRTLLYSYIDKNGGYTMLENAIYKNKTPLLIAIKDICEETAKAVVTRKGREANDGVDTLDLSFDMNEEERRRLDYEKSNLGIDELSELVKDKVLAVVKDEKSRQEQQKEITDNIQAEVDEIKEDDADAQVEVKEFYSIDSQPVLLQEATLFESIMRSSYELAIQGVKEGNHVYYDETEKVLEAMGKTYHDSKDAVNKSYKYDDRFRFKFLLKNMDNIFSNLLKNPRKTGNFEAIRPKLMSMVDRSNSVDELNFLRRDLSAAKATLKALAKNKPDIASGVNTHIEWLDTEYRNAINEKIKKLKAKDVKEHYTGDEDDDGGVYKEFKYDDVNDLGGSEETEPCGDDIDMDIILAESITQFTLMDVMHTFCLETFTPYQIRDISRALLN